MLNCKVKTRKIETYLCRPVVVSNVKYYIIFCFDGPVSKSCSSCEESSTTQELIDSQIIHTPAIVLDIDINHVVAYLSIAM